MAEFKITNEYIFRSNDSPELIFPKYTTQLMNLANQNAGATRPRNIGQLSDLFPEYLSETNTPDINGWYDWYLANYPDAINQAADKIWSQIENLRNAFPRITPDMVLNWVTDLIINKTFNGLFVQKAILQFISEIEHSTCRLASPYEEAQGIDGFVGETPFSIKPDTYEYMGRLHDQIYVRIITYSKRKDGIVITY